VAGCGSRDDHESRRRSDISQAPRLRVIAAEVFAEDVCPYIRVTDDYGRLICSAVEILGGVSPSSVQDLVIRDLLSDVFDFLYEGRRVIMSGQRATAYPLLRRAFESLSLMVACCFDPAIAERWHSGVQIPNREVRKIDRSSKASSKAIRRRALCE